MLCPVDFSDAGEEALRYAVSLAAQLRVESVHILYVHQAARAAASGAAIAEAGAALKQDAARRLEDVAKRYCAHSVDVVPHFIEGVPYEAIPEQAARLGVDLIVMASRGRTGVKHTLLGSVAERVVRSSSVPVCTVPVRRKPH